MSTPEPLPHQPKPIAKAEQRRYPDDVSLSAIYDNTGIYMMNTDAIIRDATGKAKTILEFKHANTQSVNLNSWQFQALRSDAEALQVPLFAVVYYHLDANGKPINAAEYRSNVSTEIVSQIKQRAYLTIAGNERARAILKAPYRNLSASEFFKLQSKLSGTKLRGDHSTEPARITRLPAIEGLLA